MERVRDQIEWLAAYQRKMLNSQLRKHGLNLNGRPSGRGGRQENICILLRKAKRLADWSRKAFKCLTKVPYLMVNFLHKGRLVTKIFLQTFPLEPSGHELFTYNQASILKDKTRYCWRDLTILLQIPHPLGTGDSQMPMGCRGGGRMQKLQTDRGITLLIIKIQSISSKLK